MERLDIEVDPPVDGVTMVGLFQPSYRHKDFVLKVRETITNYQMSPKFRQLRENFGIVESGEPEKASAGNDQTVQIYTMLKITGDDISGLMSDFAKMLQDPKVAQSNGAALPPNFANNLSLAQFEKLFGGYLNFFISM